MNLFFVLEITNNTNYIFNFNNFVSSYPYNFNITKKNIKPNEKSIIRIEIIYGLPIIGYILFDKGQLNILNQVQKHCGSSIFNFIGNNKNITSQIIYKQRFQPEPNLPVFSLVNMNLILLNN